MPHELTRVPEELTRLPNWVCWRAAEEVNPVTGEVKRRKLPFQVNGKGADASDPKTWNTYDAVCAAAGFDGVGFEITPPYFGVDLDHVIDEAGKLDPEAARIVELMDSYTELSMSGTGLHIICKGTVPDHRCKAKLPGGRAFELYHEKRYFIVTGQPYGEPKPIREATQECAELVKQYFSKASTGEKKKEAPSAKTLTDDELMSRIRRSTQGFLFTSLWDGDTSDYNGDDSAADLALCNILAFWTQGDAERMDELFRRSGLMRDKWDQRHGERTYGEMTIEKAIADTSNHYGDRAYMSAEDSPFHRFEAAYEDSFGCMVRHGVTYAITLDKQGNEVKHKLADFAALPVEAIKRDDGVDAKMEFIMEGIASTGERFPAVSVPSAKFGAMNWPMESWGFAANISPGQAVKDKLRHAIQAAGAKTAKQRTIYAHTGWRRIGGKLAYLYHGGAIGAENVCVELEGNLSSYTFPEQGGSLKPSLEMLDVLPHHISIPLLAHIYLAPLTEFLTSAGYPPMHTLFLAGTSGARKSTVAALGLSHFGSTFSNTHMPASFKDTGNAIGRKAFLLKDTLLLVDDLHPTSSPQERRRMDSVAQSAARMWGDRADRGRLRSDLSMQEGNPPRGIGMMTGEDLPEVGESGLARFLLIEVKPDDVSRLNELSVLQDKAKNGELAAAMRSYIEWLLPQGGQLPGRLRDRFKTLRADMAKAVQGVHGRQHDNAAALLLGFEMFLNCAEERGDIPSARREALLLKAKDVLNAISEAQKQTVRNESPVRMFLETLGELIRTKAVYVAPLVGNSPDPMTIGLSMVGYRDKDRLYLIPGVAYTAVAKQLNMAGTAFPVSKATLWKRAVEQGYVEPDGKGGASRTKRISKTSDRYVWFNLERLRDENLISFGDVDPDDDI